MKKKLLMVMFISILNIVAIAQPGITNDTKCTTCYKTIVTGENASTLGQFTKSTGIASFASGNYSIASGDYSHAFGDNSKATQRSAFAAGSFAEANGLYSISLGRYTFANTQSSVAIGKYVMASGATSFAYGMFLTSSASFAFTLGTGYADDKRLENNVNKSLMIGFNSKLPTFFVGKSLGADRTGNIGIGNITLPESKLHIKADDNEDASVYLQPTNSNYYGKIFLGDKNNMISAKSGGDIEFETITGRDFGFIKGNIIHDAGLYIATSQIKAPDATGLSLTNMNGNGIFVDDGGNVGIGTTPNNAYALDVNGPVNFLGDLYQNGQPFETTKWGENGTDIYYNTGNVGINTSTPDANLDIVGDIALGKEGEKFLLHSRQWDGDKFMIVPQNNGGNWEFDKSLTLFDNGNVGIGVTELVYASAKLTVKGDIHAREVLVTLSAGGADFVFDEGYELPKLKEVEEYIAKNHHLADIPSAKQMEEDGLDLGKMQIKLLQKIEELTLYIIEQQKRIDKLEYESNK